MSCLRRLPPEVLRKRLASAHHQLQAAGTRILKLEERIQILEAENKHLHRAIGEDKCSMRTNSQSSA